MNKSLIIDPNFADPTYIRRKIELASRVALNRQTRASLREKLELYRKMEKTGEKSLLENPKTRGEILALQEAIKLETMLGQQLTEQLKIATNTLTETNNHVKELSEMIQNQKELQQTNVSSEFLKNRQTQLKERETLLKNAIGQKESRLKDLKKEIERLTLEKSKQLKQKEITGTIHEWNQGNSHDGSEVQKLAYDLYQHAYDAYHDAQKALELKDFTKYYILLKEALLNGIDCAYLLASKDVKTYTVIDYHLKIDTLFKQKIVVNPIMLDSIINLVNRIENGVSVEPSANFKADVFDYVVKNLKSLKIVE